MIQNAYCASLIDAVAGHLKLGLNLQPGASNNLLRLVVSSFGSPVWQLANEQSSDLTATLILLKSLLRATNTVAVVTLPHHLLGVIIIQSINQSINIDRLIE